MGYFRDSAEEVQICIDALVSAQVYQDAELRKSSALPVVEQVAALRVGKQLAPQIRKLIEADDLNRAILLLRTYQEHRGLRIGPIAFALVPIVAAGYFLVMPRVGGHHEAALKVAGECSSAAEILGDDLEMPTLGFPTGSTQSNSGMSFAGWTIPVQGTRARATLSYLAYEHQGPWDVYHAHLSHEGKHYLVVPCWGQVSESDAEGLLSKGYEGSGKVITTSGSAPVKQGDSCSLLVAPERDFPGKIPFNCKLRVTCANQALYGGNDQGGYAFCHPRDGAPVAAFDDGGTDATGDPILELDLDKKKLRLADDGAGKTYDFTVQL
ncbi:MAG: hypothetical protein JRI23_09145 [Deltaproteobacteria bacterium]|jgi:hypothetical protein|nr:hypothetical protein [Deltaproteobacteria bacterium]MBW2531804.1 hypothetical protein [Deltaproteobacteria bacterium]